MMALAYSNKIKGKIQVFILSFIYYITTYLIILFINRYATLFIAADFGIKTIIRHGDIIFITLPSSSLWTRDAILSISMAGHVICLLTGICVIAFYNFHKLTRIPYAGVWICFHAFNFALGAILYKLAIGTGIPAGALHLGTPVKIVVALASVYFLGKSGYYFAPAFCLTPAYCSCNRQKEYLFAVILPWITGSTILLPIVHGSIKIEGVLSFLSLLFFIVPVFWRMKKYKQKVFLPKFSHMQLLAWCAVAFILISFIALYISAISVFLPK
ncbi:MAG: hypothetical protein M0R21_04240 [Lentimicrobiaceae bacterium]|nr:hypothetical protein [Lentimicrobiaceae bacterium]